MALYLVQHGLSEAKEVDPERGLTVQGRIDTERMAQLAKDSAVPIKGIVHSGKRRAEQTAAIFHSILRLSTPVQKISGIDPLDDVKDFAHDLRPDSGTMVVGHLPFLQRLVGYLLTGSVDTTIYRFQNSGVVCLDTEIGGNGSVNWFIKWTLTPHIS